MLRGDTYCCAVDKLLQLWQYRGKVRQRELVQVEDKYLLFVHIQLRQPDIDGHKVDPDVVNEFKVFDFRGSQTAQRYSVTFSCELRQRNEHSKTNAMN